MGLIMKEILKTKNLILKEMKELDIDNLCDILTNQEVSLTYMLPIFKTKEDVLKLANSLINKSRQNKCFLYGIFLKDKLIGFINEVMKNGKEIELGYVINPQYKNNGFATEALKESINYLFNNGFEFIKTGFFKGNIASMRVMEKSGMKRLEEIEEIEYRDKVYKCYFYGIRK